MKEIVIKISVLHHFILKDKFECAIDYDGMIWIKQKNKKYFDKPCMRYCYTEIKQRDPIIADFILNKSCEYQDNKAVTKRAQLYKKE